MEQYISKSALVAEIENRINKYILLQQKSEMSDLQKELQDKIDCLNSIKGYIFNTIEVKEMDLKKELSYEDYVEFFKEHPNFSDDWGFDEAWVFAKYFFELGLKAQKGE